MKPIHALLAVVLSAVVVVAAFLGWKVGLAPTDPPMSATHDRPECGHNWADSVTVAEVKDIVNVPEYHDCQRFVVKQGTGYQYDAMFAIFVSATIRDLTSRLGPVQTVPVRPVGTVIAVSPPAPGTVPREKLTAGMVTVVFATGSYAPLGIQPGLNCLYVWRFFAVGAPQQTEVWSARMVPKPGATSCPDATVGAIGPGKDLNVSRTQVGGFTNPDDYPPVTRWDWDDVNAKQYVGVTCGAAWCEIYDGVLTPSPPLPVAPNDPIEVRRVRLIKGWYDQQFVATFDANGNPVPTRVLGTIVPDPALGAKGDTDFNGWVHVADISLTPMGGPDPGTMTKYKHKFNFVDTPVDNPTTLEVKGKVGQDMWKARIKRPGPFWWFTVKHKNVMRRAHASSYDVPGVARWRWMTSDEGTWIRCTGGCCEMSDY